MDTVTNVKAVTDLDIKILILPINGGLPVKIASTRIYKLASNRPEAL
jgi:hypothetical protein